jgi:hypothetical protein
MGCPLTDQQRTRIAEYRKETEGRLAMEQIRKILNLRDNQI